MLITFRSKEPITNPYYFNSLHILINSLFLAFFVQISNFFRIPSYERNVYFPNMRAFCTNMVESCTEIILSYFLYARAITARLLIFHFVQEHALFTQKERYFKKFQIKIALI